MEHHFPVVHFENDHRHADILLTPVKSNKSGQSALMKQSGLSDHVLYRGSKIGSQDGGPSKSKSRSIPDTIGKEMIQNQSSDLLNDDALTTNLNPEPVIATAESQSKQDTKYMKTQTKSNKSKTEAMPQQQDLKTNTNKEKQKNDSSVKFFFKKRMSAKKISSLFQALSKKTSKNASERHNQIEQPNFQQIWKDDSKADVEVLYARSSAKFSSKTMQIKKRKRSAKSPFGDIFNFGKNFHLLDKQNYALFHKNKKKYSKDSSKPEEYTTSQSGEKNIDVPESLMQQITATIPECISCLSATKADVVHHIYSAVPNSNENQNIGEVNQPQCHACIPNNDNMLQMNTHDINKKKSSKLWFPYDKRRTRVKRNQSKSILQTASAQKKKRRSRNRTSVRKSEIHNVKPNVSVMKEKSTTNSDSQLRSRFPQNQVDSFFKFKRKDRENSAISPVCNLLEIESRYTPTRFGKSKYPCHGTSIAYPVQDKTHFKVSAPSNSRKNPQRTDRVSSDLSSLSVNQKQYILQRKEKKKMSEAKICDTELDHGDKTSTSNIRKEFVKKKNTQDLASSIKSPKRTTLKAAESQKKKRSKSCLPSVKIKQDNPTLSKSSIVGKKPDQKGHRAKILHTKIRPSTIGKTTKSGLNSSVPIYIQRKTESEIFDDLKNRKVHKAKNIGENTNIDMHGAHIEQQPKNQPIKLYNVEKETNQSALYHHFKNKSEKDPVTNKELHSYTGQAIDTEKQKCKQPSVKYIERKKKSDICDFGVVPKDLEWQEVKTVVDPTKINVLSFAKTEHDNIKQKTSPIKKYHPIKYFQRKNTVDTYSSDSDPQKIPNADKINKKQHYVQKPRHNSLKYVQMNDKKYDSKLKAENLNDEFIYKSEKDYGRDKNKLSNRTATKNKSKNDTMRVCTIETIKSHTSLEDIERVKRENKLKIKNRSTVKYSQRKSRITDLGLHVKSIKDLKDSSGDIIKNKHDVYQSKPTKLAKEGSIYKIEDNIAPRVENSKDITSSMKYKQRKTTLNVSSNDIMAQETFIKDVETTNNKTNGSGTVKYVQKQIASGLNHKKNEVVNYQAKSMRSRATSDSSVYAASQQRLKSFKEKKIFLNRSVGRIEETSGPCVKKSAFEKFKNIFFLSSKVKKLKSAEKGVPSYLELGNIGDNFLSKKEQGVQMIYTTSASYDSLGDHDTCESTHEFQGDKKKYIQKASGTGCSFLCQKSQTEGKVPRKKTTKYQNQNKDLKPQYEKAIQPTCSFINEEEDNLNQSNQEEKSAAKIKDQKCKNKKMYGFDCSMSKSKVSTEIDEKRKFVRKLAKQSNTLAVTKKPCAKKLISLSTTTSLDGDRNISLSGRTSLVQKVIKAMTARTGRSAKDRKKTTVVLKAFKSPGSKVPCALEEIKICETPKNIQKFFETLHLSNTIQQGEENDNQDLAKSESFCCKTIPNKGVIPIIRGQKEIKISGPPKDVKKLLNILSVTQTKKAATLRSQLTVSLPGSDRVKVCGHKKDVAKIVELFDSKKPKKEKHKSKKAMKTKKKKICPCTPRYSQVQTTPVSTTKECVNEKRPAFKQKCPKPCKKKKSKRRKSKDKCYPKSFKGRMIKKKKSKSRQTVTVPIPGTDRITITGSRKKVKKILQNLPTEDELDRLRNIRGAKQIKSILKAVEQEPKVSKKKQIEKATSGKKKFFSLRKFRTAKQKKNKPQIMKRRKKIEPTRSFDRAEICLPVHKVSSNLFPSDSSKYSSKDSSINKHDRRLRKKSRQNVSKTPFATAPTQLYIASANDKKSQIFIQPSEITTTARKDGEKFNLCITAKIFKKGKLKCKQICIPAEEIQTVSARRGVPAFTKVCVKPKHLRKLRKIDFCNPRICKQPKFKFLKKKYDSPDAVCLTSTRDTHTMLNRKLKKPKKSPYRQSLWNRIRGKKMKPCEFRQSSPPLYVASFSLRDTWCEIKGNITRMIFLFFTGLLWLPLICCYKLYCCFSS